MSQFNGTSQDFERLTQMRETFFRPMSELGANEFQAVENLFASPNKIVHKGTREKSHFNYSWSEILASAGIIAFFAFSYVAISIQLPLVLLVGGYAFIAASGIGYLYESVVKFRSKLGNRVVVSPMYVLQTSKDGVNYWGIWAFTQLQRTEVFLNGVYSSTEVGILFPFDAVYFNIHNRDSVNQLEQALYAWREHALAAIERRDWNYFQPLDFLAPLRQSSPQVNAIQDFKTPTKKSAANRKKLIICVVVSLLFGLLAGFCSKAVYESDQSKPSKRSVRADG